MKNEEKDPGGLLHSSFELRTSNFDAYRGWIRPGPRPPGGVAPEDGETLDYISGHFGIFQFERGHRFSTDDVLTGALGEVLAGSYLAVRRSEWEAYSAADEAFEQQGHFEKY